MPTKAPTPCPRCGGLGNCAHRGINTRRLRNTRAWKAESRAARARHLAQHGATCPGWNRPPHPCRPEDLTLDHVEPLTRTDTSPRQVLCRSCNSAKGTN